MRCVLVCGGEFAPQKFVLEKDDVLVAVDKGFDYIKDVAKPRYVVGDFDSLGYIPEGLEVIRHNPIKDFTDTQLALEFMSENGYDDFVIYGGFGGRLDHTIANIQTAYDFVKKGKKIKFVAKDCQAEFIVSDKTMNGEKGRFFSLFCLDKAEGVDITGAKYEIKDSCLSNDYPLGVSNEFTDKECHISVKKGILLLIVNDKGIV